jgi:hypothetical protein
MSSNVMGSEVTLHGNEILTNTRSFLCRRHDEGGKIWLVDKRIRVTRLVCKEIRSLAEILKEGIYPHYKTR